MKKPLIAVITVLAFCAFTTSVWAQPYTDPIADDDYGIAQGGGNTGAPTPNDDNDAQPDINDAINLLLGGLAAIPGYVDAEHNSDVDYLQYTSPNSFWRDFSDADNSGTFVAISLTAANDNTLGIYRTSGDTTDIPLLGPYSGAGFLGDGGSDPFPAAMSPLNAGENFGFYLMSNATRWDSDPTANSDLYDHMMVYQLSELAGTTVEIGFNCTQSPAGPGEDIGAIACSSTDSYTFYDPYLIVWEDKAYGSVEAGKLGDEDYDDMIYLVDRVRPVPEPMTMLLLGSGLLGLAGFRRKKS